MKKRKKQKRVNLKSVVLFAASIAVAYLIISLAAFESLLLALTPLTFVAELIAGVLYTSFMTIPISLSLLSVLVQEGNIYFIALVAAAGAALGDFFIMNIFQKVGDAVQVKSKKLDRLQKNPIVRALTVLVGLVCLATPIPDEIAMGILGISKIKPWHFFAVVYPAKVLGLIAVLLSLQSIQ